VLISDRQSDRMSMKNC